MVATTEPAAVTSASSPSKPAGCGRRTDGDRLTRAIWLGYLKVRRSNDPLIAPYFAACHAVGKSAVLLFTWHRQFAAIIYQSPVGGNGLDEEAIVGLRNLARAIQATARDHVRLITPHGGEITGLQAGRAEELAFRIADALLDAR